MRQLVLAVPLLTLSAALIPARAQPAPGAKPSPAVSAAPQAASPGHPGWIADSRTGCRVWDGAPIESETVTWTGPCVDGLADGEGALVRRSNGTVVSMSRSTKRRGHTAGSIVTILQDGTSYAGEVQDDVPSGQGVVILADGTRYEGAISAGKPDGEGTLTRADGEVRRGVWHTGCLREGGAETAFLARQADCARAAEAGQPAPAQDASAATSSPGSDAQDIGLLMGEQEACGVDRATREGFAARYMFLLQVGEGRAGGYSQAGRDIDQIAAAGKERIRSGQETCDGLKAALAGYPQRLATTAPDTLRGGLLMVSKMLGAASACGIAEARLTAILDGAVDVSQLPRTKALTAALQQGWREGAAKVRDGQAGCGNVPGYVDVLGEAFPG